MENQHRKISGYRELSQEEIDLINEANALEKQCMALCKRLNDNLAATTGGSKFFLKENEEERKRFCDADPFKWMHCGRVNIETGFMQIIRAIAQPAQ